MSAMMIGGIGGWKMTHLRKDEEIDENLYDAADVELCWRVSDEKVDSLANVA